MVSRLAVVGLVLVAVPSGVRSEPVALQTIPSVLSQPVHRTELVVRVTRRLPIRAQPGAGSVIGRMPPSSPSYQQPTHAWVISRSPNGRFGRVPVPFVARHRAGWIDLSGLTLSRTAIRVNADLSRHVLVVLRRGHVLYRFRAATGAPATPTPTGRYFVTDRVPFVRTSPYGSFAFGLSGIQPNLPAGWTGGDQLAIHGTNQPTSIGKSVSTGCLRVSHHALMRLKPLLQLGTPVVIST